MVKIQRRETGKREIERQSFETENEKKKDRERNQKSARGRHRFHRHHRSNRANAESDIVTPDLRRKERARKRER